MPCECGEVQKLEAATPAYRRALVVVIILNLGMGSAEMLGGFLGHSACLKADALDFLGDGTITLLAFTAMRRGAAWRSRAALWQGVFLGVLGVSVIAAALVRAFRGMPPEAGTMGVLGATALVTNLTAAWVLIPHRHGDVTARAVWLFSRNDALGNLAVVAAAGLVSLLDSRWPDIIAALAIACLFVSSALEIIRRARAAGEGPKA